MKRCKYCMSEIHKDATVCPVCKRRIDWSSFDKILTIFLFTIAAILFVVLIISYALRYANI